jgi:hypothetical protein
VTTVDLSTAELEHLVLARGTSPDLEWVEVDGECIVWCARSQELHHLDRIASLIFRLCDGNVSVATTIDELATSFGVDRTRVAADLGPCLRFLLSAGLVVWR